MIPAKQIHVQSRAVLIKQGYILLCKTTGLKNDFYFLPGGHIDLGESATQACLRELKEEIGGNFKIVRFLGCMEYSFDPALVQHAKCHTQEYTFIFEATSEELTASEKPTQKEDHIKMEWMPFNDLNQIDLRPEPIKEQLPIWLNADLKTALASHMV